MGVRPAQPIAVSVWPRRQARPKLSAMTVAGGRGCPPPDTSRQWLDVECLEEDTPGPFDRFFISFLMARAEASGLVGSRQTVPCSGRFEVSMPAFAQTKPWWVSVM